MRGEAVGSGAAPVKELTPVVRPNEQRARIRYLLAAKGKTQRDIQNRAAELLGEPVTEAMVSFVISGDRAEGEKAQAIRRAIAELTRKPLRDLFDAD